MFQAGIQERIQLIQPTLVECGDDCFCLTEKGEGKADLKIQAHSQCILIRNLETNKPGYFVNKKCADYVLFENTDHGWKVHIFELKRTIKLDVWETEIKKQFQGAMQNILALAGVLGMEIKDIVLHTVYRNDKVNDMVNPVKQHLGKQYSNKSRTDWNKEEIALEFLERKSFRHNKIKLDIETGEGKYSL